MNSSTCDEDGTRMKPEDKVKISRRLQVGFQSLEKSLRVRNSREENSGGQPRLQEMRRTTRTGDRIKDFCWRIERRVKTSQWDGWIFRTSVKASEKDEVRPKAKEQDKNEGSGTRVQVSDKCFRMGQPKDQKDQRTWVEA